MRTSLDRILIVLNNAWVEFMQCMIIFCLLV